jgi:hypothetical protein
MWLNVPKNIKGFDYNLIDLAYSKYSIIEQLILNINKYISENEKILNKFKLQQSNNDADYTHLVPPYIIPGTYSKDNCLKMAAFKNNRDQKYYCWFHVHSS